MSKQWHVDHEVRTQKKLKSNPKGFWKYINEQLKEIGLPSSMFLGDKTASNTEDICQLFAAKFSSMFTQEDLSQ